jgi:hypothetical protein
VEDQPELYSVETFPDRYQRLAVQAWSSDKISTGALAKLLRCSLVEARQTAYRYAEVADDIDGISERFSVNLTDSLLAAR